MGSLLAKNAEQKQERMQREQQRQREEALRQQRTEQERLRLEQETLGQQRSQQELIRQCHEALRQQRLEEERLRQQQIQREHQRQCEEVLQQQRTEQERLRQRQREEQERRERERQQRVFNSAVDKAVAIIDLHIRTRKKFDTTDPLRYSCLISSVVDSCEDAIRALVSPADIPWYAAEYPKLVPFSVVMGAKICRRFKMTGPTIGVNTLTPFQGEESHRVFGYFRCPCGKRWTSAATWCDKWQQCKGCEKKVYPHQQHVLEISERDEDTEARAPHDMSRCQRCRELGRLCVPSRYYAI